MNHYIVSTKCGHVGRKNYIVVDFALKAESKSEAAKKARQLPRVKRHQKDAIIEVRIVDKAEWLETKKLNKENPYLCAHSKQEQMATCIDLDLHVIQPIDDSDDDEDKKMNQAYKIKKLRYEESKFAYLIKEFYQSAEYISVA